MVDFSCNSSLGHFGLSALSQDSTFRAPKGRAFWATDMRGMLARLFREQEAREERQRMRREYGVTYEDDGLGSFDDGDPYTTNLYVGNLAPTVDEEVRPSSCCH